VGPYSVPESGKMLFFVHVIRADSLETEMMLACGEGKRRRRGWPRKWCMEEILVGTGVGLEDLQRSDEELEYEEEEDCEDSTN